MRNMTILVVDDDPVIRRMLEKRLEKEGYEVLIAEDGYQARKIIPQQHIDVVLTDLMMPGTIGGIEVLEIAKSISPNIEVILITAHSSVDTAVEAMKKGAADYLEKPINFDELFLRLEKIANVQSIMRNALDLSQAMDTTESAAAVTIQNLEIRTAVLQSRIESIISILRDEQTPPYERIYKVLDLLTDQNDFLT
ncbi:MAG: response regulator [Proteobacteria bacterium]|nr:sigma-54-dependent Fis family transcriptional regulator [Desulfocapsa sp.]MBU3945622.1 response regulator [Pseudomonadota bacterium]MCG2745867.1 response regulator [Desulfobacteraceae bacterium]MBU3983685.1 response regulator [Pseudomonadota bacterium]MBU4029664.1 response regulator [Pseudomonadota bacterium]